jgi:peptidoglycan/LPS O-acetylase OafA/YrhL
MDRQRLSCIDAIRGMACLIVIFAHIVASDANYGMYANGCGKIGVWLFMIMSGFLSFLPFATNPDRLDKIEIGYVLAYYKKKLVRLYPAYLIALLFAFAIGFITSVKDVVKSIFAIEGIGHFWYMPVILKFYVIFPLYLLLWKAVHKSAKRFSIVIIAVGVISGVAFPFNKYVENSTQLRWYIPVFMMGILLSVVYVQFREYIHIYI